MGTTGVRVARDARADVDLVAGETEHGAAELSLAIFLQSPDVVVLLEHGMVRSVNPAITARTGWLPEEVLGRSITDLVHPEDLKRAAFDLSMYASDGTIVGQSSYRILMADGTYELFGAVAANVVVAGRPLMALYCRRDNSASPAVLEGLLRATSTAEMLRPVCDVFDWEIHGSLVGICWYEDGRALAVSTGLPDALAGGDDDCGTPWTRCRESGIGIRASDTWELDPARRALAAALGVGPYWIEPVLDDAGEVCALITVWINADGHVPELHQLGMSMAKNYVELIVRWNRQRRQLDDAAHRDTLTGVANRKAFYEALDDPRGGAVLYCDLDGFKPVNDERGHGVGDELLCAVARRIQACVRQGDVVARIGGDEFGVLCAGITDDQATELAERISAAIGEPFHVTGSTTTIGISIGIAHGSGRLGQEALDLADRALYRAKAAGGGVCWSSEG